MKKLTTASILAHTALAAGMSEPEVEGLLIEAGYNPTPRADGMDRRGFLKAFSLGVGAVAGAALIGDVDKALWTPGAKTFFLPPEKAPVIGGPEALAAVKEMRLGDIKDEAHFKALTRGEFPIAAHEVPTGAGRARFDANWNLLTLNGRPVTAHEAAVLQSSTYSGWRSNARHTPAELRQLAQEIRARRELAGIQEPS